MNYLNIVIVKKAISNIKKHSIINIKHDYFMHFKHFYLSNVFLIVNIDEKI